MIYVNISQTYGLYDRDVRKLYAPKRKLIGVDSQPVQKPLDTHRITNGYEFFRFVTYPPGTNVLCDKCKSISNLRLTR
jgi:hypothetical protein